MSLSSYSVSDTASEDTMSSSSPATNPLLSMYRRELTDRRDEISQLKQQLGGVQDENKKLERALDMSRLNGCELDCELQEAMGRLEGREPDRGQGQRGKQGLRADRLGRYSDESRYFFPDPYSYLDKYELQHAPASKGGNIARDPPNPPPPPQSAPATIELVKPLTYQKNPNLSARWLTHAPSSTSYTGIFQPLKTKGKLVTQPRKEDLVGKKHARDKYVLNHQEASPDGSHLVTTLYKGNVNPTRSGGAQVRFTDTEMLHQCRDGALPTRDTSTQRQAPSNRFRMATIEDARKNPNPNPNPYYPHPMEFGKSMDKDWSNAKLRMATLKDAKVMPKHNPGSHVRRATIDDAMLPPESRYFFLV